MKNLLKYLLLCLLSFSLNIAVAQTGEEEEEDEDFYEDRYNWKQGIVIGGSIFPAYSNGWILELSPLVGYKITGTTIIGVGFNYYYRDIRYTYGKDVFNVYGGRAFVIQDVLPQFFAQMEVDYNFAKYTERDPFNTIVYQDNWEAPGFLLGLGYKQGDEHFSYNFSALYDLQFDQFSSTRSSPLVFRATVILALF